MSQPYRLTVNASAHRPSHPTAELQVTARRMDDLITVIQLRLHWRDGRSVVEWSMQDTVHPMARRHGGIMDMLGHGEPWQQSAELRDELYHARSTTFPDVTTALRAMVPVALAWEHAPIRHTDRLLKRLHQLMHTVITAGPVKPPELPEVDLTGPEVLEHDERRPRRRSRPDAVREAREAQIERVRQRRFEWFGRWWKRQCACGEQAQWRLADRGAPLCIHCGRPAELLTGDDLNDEDDDG